MQKINLILKYCFFSLSILTLASCEKDYEGDSYDFSNSVAPYVELSAKTAVTVTEGSALTSVFQVRTALQEDVTVGYQITGGYTTSGNVVIPRNSRSGNLSVTIPVGTVPVGSTSVAAVLKIVSVTRPSGGAIIVGRLGADLEKRNVTIKN